MQSAVFVHILHIQYYQGISITFGTAGLH